MALTKNKKLVRDYKIIIAAAYVTFLDVNNNNIINAIQNVMKFINLKEFKKTLQEVLNDTSK